MFNKFFNKYSSEISFVSVLAIYHWNSDTLLTFRLSINFCYLLTN